MPKINDLAALFKQLGLPDSPGDIDTFIQANQLPREMKLESAPCWKFHQVTFLVTAKDDDADWSDAVDELDALLHQDSVRYKNK